MSTWSRVRNVFRRDLNKEIDAELASHLDEAQAAGRDLLAVKRTMGSRLNGREAVRDAIVAAWLESLVQDVRYALRGLRRHPGFTLVAASSLALAIGANTTIFSVAKQLLFERLDVPNAPTCVCSRRPTSRTRLRAAARAESGARRPLAFHVTAVNATVGDNAERVLLHEVSGNYYAVLGVSRNSAARLVPPTTPRAAKPWS